MGYESYLDHLLQFTLNKRRIWISGDGSLAFGTADRSPNETCNEFPATAYRGVRIHVTRPWSTVAIIVVSNAYRSRYNVMARPCYLGGDQEPTSLLCNFRQHHYYHHHHSSILDLCSSISYRSIRWVELHARIYTQASMPSLLHPSQRSDPIKPTRLVCQRLRVPSLSLARL